VERAALCELKEGEGTARVRHLTHCRGRDGRPRVARPQSLRGMAAAWPWRRDGAEEAARSWPVGALVMEQGERRQQPCTAAGQCCCGQR
jgi:hypothetical protein